MTSIAAHKSIARPKDFHNCYFASCFTRSFEGGRKRLTTESRKPELLLLLSDGRRFSCFSFRDYPHQSHDRVQMKTRISYGFSQTRLVLLHQRRLFKFILRLIYIQFRIISKHFSIAFGHNWLIIIVYISQWKIDSSRKQN